VRATARHAKITVSCLRTISLPAREQLLGIRIRRRTCEHARPRPSGNWWAALWSGKPTKSRDSGASGAGRAFREIGIIMHNQEIYLALLQRRSALWHTGAILFQLVRRSTRPQIFSWRR
jgi:hypothetical protein